MVNRNLEDQILEVVVPLETVVEVKNGSKKSAQKKMFPGYVLINMVMNDDSWYVVRNCRGVTGFVGPGSKPVALTQEEVESMGLEHTVIKFDYNVGDNIRVKYGALEGFLGVITEINLDKKKVKATVSMFGRDTDVELEFNQIESIA